MTPLFCWVFLLALVGRAASVPAPLMNDACALVCNPGAETEGERERRERDPTQYPRYPKGVCKLQSSSDQDQARVLVSHCLKLCANELSDGSELNCFVLRSSIESHLGCYCPALVPLSPNTMRLHENWRITHLVNELAQDLVSIIFQSPIERGVICELHQEVFPESANIAGELGKTCRPAHGEKEDDKRTKRDIDEELLMQKIRDSIQREKLEEMEALPMENKEKVNTEELETMDEPAETPKGGRKRNKRNMSYREHINYLEYCQDSCVTETPDPHCDCDELDLSKVKT